MIVRKNANGNSVQVLRLRSHQRLPIGWIRTGTRARWVSRVRWYEFAAGDIPTAVASRPKPGVMLEETARQIDP